MESYEASATINAPAATVWSILTDTQGLTRWGSGITKIEGAIQAGGKIKVFTEVSDRAFPLNVVELTEPSRMVWQGGMPLGLFKGVRTFTLDDNAGTTAFHMREEFTGLLLPLIWKSMPDLNPSFQKFASGLKAEAEKAQTEKTPAEQAT